MSSTSHDQSMITTYEHRVAGVVVASAAVRISYTHSSDRPGCLDFRSAEIICAPGTGLTTSRPAPECIATWARSQLPALAPA